MLPLIIGGVQAALGLGQLAFGAKRPKRPTYTMPSEIKQLENRAYGRSPGYNQAAEKIDASAANSAEAAKETGNPLAAVSGILSVKNRAIEDLAATDSASRENRITAALQAVADYKDKEFQLNKFAPYSDQYNAQRELTGAGIQNTFGGLGSIATTLLSEKYLN